jgi:subtilisin family serine protease/uncharacterized protein YjdB
MRMKGPTFLWLFPTAGLSLLLSCSGDSDPAGVDPPQPTVASVTVDPGEAELTWLGETLQLAATPRDPGGNPLSGQTVSWASLDQDVVAVSVSGEITAVGNGQITVRATVGGVSGDATITVAQAPAGIALSPQDATFGAVGDTVRLIAVVEDAGGSAIEDVLVEWSTSDAAVAEVEDGGLVTATGNGDAVISATLDALSGEAPIVVDQVPAAISVTLAEITLSAVGDTARLSAEVSDSRGNTISGLSVRWTSADTGVAEVDEAGLVTAVANGETQIAATVQDVSEEVTVQVAQVAAAISIAPTQVSFDALGDTVRLAAQVLDAGGTPIEDGSLEWVSSDANVAGVDQQGLVIAVGNGVASVWAQAGELSEDAEVSVEQLLVALQVEVERDTLTFLGDSVRVEAVGVDRLGSPIPGLEVTWSSVATDVLTVDGDGWVRAQANGAAEVTAAVEQVEATTTLVVLQRAVALSLSAQPQVTSAGEPLDTAPEVAVLDAGGALVSIDNDTEITAFLGSGGGELNGTLTVQVEAGTALFPDLSIQGTAGEHTLGFSAPEMEEVVSDPFMVEPGPASGLLLMTGGGQTSLADTELPDSLTVAVVDEWDNGVPGHLVSWSIVSGGGILSADETATNALGQTSVAYTLGRHAGEEEVQAESSGLGGASVSFLVTATPNGTISGVVSLSSANLMSLAAEGTATDPSVPEPGPFRTQGQAWETGQEAPAGGPRPPGRRSESRPLVPGSGNLDPPPDPGRPSLDGDFVPGELIVTLRPEAVDAPPVRTMARAGVTEARRVGDRIRSVVGPLGRSEEGGRPDETFRVDGVSPVIHAARIRIDDPAETEAVAQRLRSDPRVAFVEPNRIIHRTHDRTGGRNEVGATAGSRPPEGPPTAPRAPARFPASDPLYPWQAWHYAMIGVPEAWEVTTGSSSVIVAVVDDGIRFDHPDIAGNLTSDGYDFVSNAWNYDVCGGGTVGRSGDGDGYDPDPTTPVRVVWDGLSDCISGVQDSGGHGLHVSGTIGAVGNDGLGGTGVNWNVAIRPVRALDIRGSGSNYDIAQAILYSAGLPADDGQGGEVAPAIPASVINLSLGGPSGSAVLADAVEAASEAGVLLIGSAGNAGNTVPNYPAAHPEVVSVSAVNPYLDLADYSSYGATIELSAPGGETSFGCDFGVISTTWNFQTNQPTWACLPGTSMAAPHVSGVAALILANEPGLTAGQVRARLRDWAVDLGDPDWDPLYGYGLVNARNSLTQSFVPDGNVHVVLYDASSGAELDRAPAGPGGSFEFGELDDGDYLVFAGRDQNSDGLIGVPRRWWGGFGGSMNPSAITVDGADIYPASFTIGFPLESEPNNSFQDANRLVLGGWVQGIITDLADVDVFRVSLPELAAYTFETSPIQGACGFALEEETLLQLYDGSGTLLREEEAIDPGALNYCSRITETLAPGDYFLAVWGNIGARRYALQAREGS